MPFANGRNPPRRLRRDHRRPSACFAPARHHDPMAADHRSIICFLRPCRNAAPRVALLEPGLIRLPAEQSGRCWWRWCSVSERRRSPSAAFEQTGFHGVRRSSRRAGAGGHGSGATKLTAAAKRNQHPCNAPTPSRPDKAQLRCRRAGASPNRMRDDCARMARDSAVVRPGESPLSQQHAGSASRANPRISMHARKISACCRYHARIGGDRRRPAFNIAGEDDVGAGFHLFRRRQSRTRSCRTRPPKCAEVADDLGLTGIS